MATNQVIKPLDAHRLRLQFSVDHLAGQFVYERGFFGWVQDDIDVSENAWGVLFTQGVYLLPNVPATLAQGLKVHAPATTIATSLPLIAAATIGQASAGHYPVGRSIATGNATVARIRLFNDNAY